MIGEEDFFEKNSEFQVWLKREKGRLFEDLSTKKAKRYFKEFVDAFNGGTLSSTQ